MFDPHLQDEEIKKKKRRVLIALLVLLLGTAAALPLVRVTGVPLAAAPEPTLELPTHTTTPIDTPVPPTHAPTQTSAPTVTSQPTATPRPTATSTPIPIPPTATEELPGGAGGGELEASATPVSAPTDAPTVVPTDTPVPPTPTPEEPGELPVTGADVGRAGRLVLGLTALSVGALMLAIGLVMRGGGKSAARETSGTIPPHLTSPLGEELDAPLPQAGTDAGTRVWLVLVLAAATLVLVFIAGHTLRRIRRQ
jgi:hypothetical protein